MIKELRASWKSLRSSAPGRRFQEQHRRRGGQRSPASGAIRIGVGVAVTVIGLVFLPAPGPGILIVALGAGLLAQESLRVARFLDAVEVQARRAITGARRLWGRSSWPARALLALSSAAVAVGLAFGSYKLFF